MSGFLSIPCSAFGDQRLLHSGPLIEVALAVKDAQETQAFGTILVFSDTTGRVVDLDLRGSKVEIVARLAQPPQVFAGRYRSSSADIVEEPEDKPASDPKGRGRPKLGVVAREVTLLPRQWEWLAAQPGGASAVLRRLVDQAKRDDGRQQRRAAQDAAYQFMVAIAGDFTGYEEATRALFADDRDRLERCMANWPQDVRLYALQLAYSPNLPS